jgi:hypothetical protein
MPSPVCFTRKKFPGELNLYIFFQLNIPIKRGQGKHLPPVYFLRPYASRDMAGRW